MIYVKPALEWAVKLLNFFPGLKTKVGAVLQVIGTLLVAANAIVPDLVSVEVVLAVNTAAATLVAVGAANQPTNNVPPQA